MKKIIIRADDCETQEDFVRVLEAVKEEVSRGGYSGFGNYEELSWEYVLLAQNNWDNFKEFMKKEENV